MLPLSHLLDKTRGLKICHNQLDYLAVKIHLQLPINNLFASNLSIQIQLQDTKGNHQQTISHCLNLILLQVLTQVSISNSHNLVMVTLRILMVYLDHL